MSKLWIDFFLNRPGGVLIRNLISDVWTSQYKIPLSPPPCPRPQWQAQHQYYLITRIKRSWHLHHHPVTLALHYKLSLAGRLSEFKFSESVLENTVPPPSSPPSSKWRPMKGGNNSQKMTEIPTLYWSLELIWNAPAMIALDWEVYRVRRLKWSISLLWIERLITRCPWLIDRIEPNSVVSSTMGLTTT